MLEPVGPLPPSVYRRRRVLACAGVLVLLGLVVWGVSSLGSAGEAPASVAAPAPASPAPSPASFAGADPAGADPAGADPAGADPTGADPTGADPTGAEADTGPAAALVAPPGGGARAATGLPGTVLGPTAPSAGQVAPAPPSPATPTAPLGAAAMDPGTGSPGGPPSAGPPSADGGAAAPESAAPGSRAPAPASSAPAAPAPAAKAARTPPPGRCADRVLRVSARTDKPRYAPGEKPVLNLVITNTGDVPCVRDLDAARQAVAVVRTPGDGLWGSNDCSPGDTDDVRTLAPGQEAVFAVRWSGRTSRPGCAGARSVVPPGTYQLLARLDDTISDPAPFTLGG